MLTTQLEAVIAKDIPQFLELNNLAVPHVNGHDMASLTALIDQAWFCRQVCTADKMHGFLLVLTKGRPYASLNYGWFCDRYDDFAYVDRIVIGEAGRGQGLAGELYQSLFVAARAAGLTRVCCEVNLEPPNLNSLAFHQYLGFVEVGQQETDGGSKRVCLLVKDLV
ncbi:MAG: putative GNAT superfamily acetyltransferase [Candidatus Azotimanducaceae bacterium]|jgi:predicted GNAT superfamily acetyltransferase